MYLNNDSAKKKKSALNSDTLMDTEADGCVCVCVLFKDDLESGEEVATCPSCSLIVRVIYDKVRIIVLNLSSRLPTGLLTVCVLLLRRPLCVESLWKLQLLLLERNWSRFSPENVS